LERGTYPSCVLFLSVPPRDVDVNVHPTKLEVKFREDRAVKDSVIHAIKNAFEILKNTDRVEPRHDGGIEIGISVSEAQCADDDAENPTAFVEAEEQEEFNYDLAREETPTTSLAASLSSATGAIFQAGGCYIVMRTDEGFAVIDQHAAHERILYELFSKASDESPVEGQNLLFPVRMDLSAEDTVILEKALPAFRGIGFQIEPFGGRSFAIQAVPSVMKDRDVRAVVGDVLADLAAGDRGARPDLLDEVVKLAACRAAIKAGDALSPEEMRSLYSQLMSCDLPFTCPHGRPTMFDMTVDDLEKRFRRK
jgi:DNA mismatch repair protein MutL